MTPTDFSILDLGLASLSLLLGAGLSIFLSLKVHRPVAIAAVRMIAQLVLVGLMLRYVLALSSPMLTLFVAAAMILAASYEVYARQQFSLRGWSRFGLGAAPVTITTVLVTGLALTTGLREASWLDARYAIPLLGIILGTVMNSTGLALNAMLIGVQREKRAIEARLALGAGGSLALRDIRTSAALNGVIPVVNQMAGAGIITLPGIMTGQILAGMDPLEAAEYQILLMTLLAGAGVIAVVLATQLLLHVVTDDRDRLRLDRIAPK